MMCAIASLACAVLLLRNYRRARLPLILWTSLCFIAFAANNVVLFVDLVIVPRIDLAILRLSLALVGAALLLYGLTTEAT
jgi:uncharacterized membrane protein